MAIGVGDALPNGTFVKIGSEGPETVELEALTKGRKVIIFGVPGAFTPTCHSAHVPSFIRTKDQFAERGVEDIYCVSVNDAFVMKAWGDSANAGDIHMLADGNASFTEALGLEMDGTGFGMGKRSQRFAMVLEGMEVKELFVEEPGAFEVSSAEHVLANL